MKIQYSLSVDDWIAWRNWADHNLPVYIRARRWNNAVLALLTLILPVAIVVTVYRNWDSQFALWAAIVAAVLSFLFMFLACLNSARAQSEAHIRSFFLGRKAIGQIGRHSLELQDQYLVETNDGEQLFSKFIRISEIFESPEYVLVVLFNGTHLIPRNKIEEGDIQEFVKELRARFSVVLESYVETENPPSITVSKKKNHSGIYLFILAAIVAIPSLISFAIMKSAGPNEMERCAKIINSCTNCERCKDFLHAEVFLYFSAPLSVLLLLISLYKFYKNSIFVR